MAQPILVDRELKRRHLRIDRHAPARDPVQVILAQHLVKGMREVKPADVTVARPAQVIGIE